MIAKNITKFILLLVPVVFLISLLRSLSVGDFHVPEYAEWIQIFSDIGGNESLMVAIEEFSTSTVIVNHTEITDFNSFLVAYGLVWNQFLKFIDLLFQILQVPLRVLAWLFGFNTP